MPCSVAEIGKRAGNRGNFLVSYIFLHIIPKFKVVFSLFLLGFCLFCVALYIPVLLKDLKLGGLGLPGFQKGSRNKFLNQLD